MIIFQFYDFFHSLLKKKLKQTFATVINQYNYNKVAQVI